MSNKAAKFFLGGFLRRGPKVTTNAARAGREYAGDLAALGQKRGGNFGRNALLGAGVVGLGALGVANRDKFNLDAGDFFQPENSENEPDNNETDNDSPAPTQRDTTTYNFDDVPNFGPATDDTSFMPKEKPSSGSGDLKRDPTSILDSPTLSKFFDKDFVLQRDRENFKRLLIQNELSQQAGLAKSRERSRREIEKQRIASWQAVNQQSILRDQAMFQSAATAIAATNPSNALARLQSMPLTDIGDIVPTRVIKSS